MKRSRRHSSKGFLALALKGPVRRPRRNIVVLMGLMGALVLTSGLLLVLMPAPLVPDAGGLVATDRPDEFEVVFSTRPGIQSGRWEYIFVHHSRTRRGNAFEAEAGGDHFVIGNGDGYPDGAIQITHRWAQQQGGAVAGGTGGMMSENCISICLVGDFNVRPPTAAQVNSLTRFIAALQRRLSIPSRNVLLQEGRADAGGVGRQFPERELRAALP